MNLGYSKYELKDIIISNGRCIFYDDTKFLKLKNFFTLSLGMSTREFCSLTTKHQRIINLSLNDSLGTIINSIFILISNQYYHLSCEG
jgi:hypothetical protein